MIFLLTSPFGNLILPMSQYRKQRQSVGAKGSKEGSLYCCNAAKTRTGVSTFGCFRGRIQIWKRLQRFSTKPQGILAWTGSPCIRNAIFSGSNETSRKGRGFVSLASDATVKFPARQTITKTCIDHRIISERQPPNRPPRIQRSLLTQSAAMGSANPNMHDTLGLASAIAGDGLQSGGPSANGGDPVRIPLVNTELYVQI